MATEPHPRRSRRGDSEILTFQPRGQAGRVEVYAHDDAGVTLSRFDYRGDEAARISLVREDWLALVDFVKESQGGS